MTHRQPIT
uniref:Uncharacterized protein n=1 Tax=Nymphaea colorata TaxID=210225 RepID=A0A5K0V1V3_9MAGN